MPPEETSLEVAQKHLAKMGVPWSFAWGCSEFARSIILQPRGASSCGFIGVLGHSGRSSLEVRPFWEWVAPF